MLVKMYCNGPRELPKIRFLILTPFYREIWLDSFWVHMDTLGAQRTNFFNSNNATTRHPILVTFLDKVASHT